MRLLLVALMLLAGCAGVTDDVRVDEEDEPSERPAPEEEADEDDPQEITSRPVENGSEPLETTTVEKPYTATGVGPWAMNTGCEELQDPGGPDNVGGACFRLPKGTQKVEFGAVDDVMPQSALYVRYAGGAAEGFFCDEGAFRPAADAQDIIIVLGSVGCFPLHPVPTTGTITVTFHHPPEAAE